MVRCDACSRGNEVFPMCKEVCDCSESVPETAKRPTESAATALAESIGGSNLSGYLGSVVSEVVIRPREAFVYVPDFLM